MIEMERITRGIVVRDVITGKIGVTVDDIADTCSPEETPVVFEGETSFLGIGTEELEVLGPEKAVADLKRCGAGQGKQCCVFLVIGEKGPECQRFAEMRNSLIFRKEEMGAQREPTEMYPRCQLK